MHRTPRAVMLFAAGFGTRMAPLTHTIPKAMIPVAGRPLIDHALDLTEGFGRRVVNLHHLGDRIAQHLAGRDVALSWEQAAPLDTGGGLRHALPLLGEGPVATLNTDAVWTGRNPFDTLRAAWRPGRMDALLLLVPRIPGDFAMDGAGRLTRGGGFTYTGAQIVKTEGLNRFPDAAFSLNRLWDEIAAEGRLFGVVYPGGWCDVGHPDGIDEAEQMLNAAHV